MENTKDLMIEKVLELTKDLTNANSKIDGLNREMGSKNEYIANLDKQIQELNSKQPEVRITTQKTYDQWGDPHFDDKVEYFNLELVKSNLKKDLDKEYNSKIEKLEKDLKNTLKTLEGKDEEIEKIRKSYDSERANIRQDYDLKSQELDREYRKKNDKKNQEIKELQEELEKVKTNKTDEELEKQRNEEILKLKLQIKELKKQIEEFLSFNIFKRTWYAITNKAVRVAAEKEVIEREREIDDIKMNYEGISRGHGIFDFYRNWF